MKHLAWLVCVLLLAGCASTREATHSVTDNRYVDKFRQADSLFWAMWQRDSIYQRDSIVIREKDDTVTKYVERTKYVLEARTDTVYRDRFYTDTLYVTRTDSVRVETPVYIEKQMTWYDKGFIWVGRLCCIAAILWVLFLYLKHKF